jgi:hypothetical protein
MLGRDVVGGGLISNSSVILTVTLGNPASSSATPSTTLSVEACVVGLFERPDGTGGRFIGCDAVNVLRSASRISTTSVELTPGASPFSTAAWRTYFDNIIGWMPKSATT